MDTDVGQEQWIEDLEAAEAGSAEALASLKEAVEVGGSMSTNISLHITAQTVSLLKEARSKGVDAIGQVALARGSVLDLSKSRPATQARLKDAKAALLLLNGLEKQLLALDTQALKAGKAVDKRLGQLLEGSRRFDAQVTAVGTTLGVLEPMFETAKARMTRLAADAGRHRDEHDPVKLRLDATQLEAIALKPLGVAVEAIATLFAAIEAGMHDVALEKRKERSRDRVRFRIRHERLESDLKLLHSVRKEVLAMKVDAVDLARAAKAIGLGAAEKGALGRALRGNEGEVLRKLDELSKSEGLRLRGKEILALLRKERLM
jgi:hypothetical protein